MTTTPRIELTENESVTIELNEVEIEFNEDFNPRDIDGIDFFFDMEDIF